MEEKIIAFISHLRIVDVVVLLIVGWFILSGSAKKVLRKTKKAKIGMSGLEYEAADDDSKDIARIDQRYADCQVNLTHRFDAIEVEMAEDRRNFGKVIDKIEKKIDSGNSDIVHLLAQQRKLTFYTSDIPDAQQLVAGLEYVAGGGNGECKKDVTEFARSMPEVYETVCTLRPELKLIEL